MKKLDYEKHARHIIERVLMRGMLSDWFEIKKGDEVISSGLDKIFFKGLKVGKVISTSRSNGFQTAIVSPYYKSNDPSYFHIIKLPR